MPLAASFMGFTRNRYFSHSGRSPDAAGFSRMFYRRAIAEALGGSGAGEER
jgi:hypothetical protein